MWSRPQRCRNLELLLGDRCWRLGCFPHTCSILASSVWVAVLCCCPDLSCSCLGFVLDLAYLDPPHSQPQCWFAGKLEGRRRGRPPPRQTLVVPRDPDANMLREDCDERKHCEPDSQKSTCTSRTDDEFFPPFVESLRKHWSQRIFSHAGLFDKDQKQLINISVVGEETHW